MKAYQNITALIEYIIATPIVVMIALLKLPLLVITFVNSNLLLRKYRGSYEWNFVRKYGKTLQFLLDGFLS